MKWDTIALLVAQYGLPLAQSIWQKWIKGAEPTAEDWEELRKLSNQTARTQVEDGLARAGIALDSPEAVALLKLVKD